MKYEKNILELRTSLDMVIKSYPIILRGLYRELNRLKEEVNRLQKQA